MSDVQEVAESLLSSKIVLCQTIKGGRNSQVYKFECANGEYFIGKFYYQNKADTRDRLGVEFSSLEILWDRGIRSIPQPFMMDQKNNCALYHFVDGRNFNGQEVTKADINQVLGFVIDLQDIKKEIPVSQFSSASEACFSIKNIWTNVEHRRRRLDGVEHTELRDFLADFDSFWLELIQWNKEKAIETGISLTEPISLEQRILSPSDFGFHNAIKKQDDTIVFCDFEYFGWDDPAKMTSDFVLHPGMRISSEVKEYFAQGIHKIFSSQEKFKDRLELVYPLFGMKWCLILLNEFLSQDLSRRLFADDKINQENLLKEQLGKAKEMLKTIKNTYRENSYAK